MSTHADQPDRHGEAWLAAYSHAASNPVSEWSYRHTHWYAGVTVFLLTLTCAAPVLAAILALVVAGGMVGGGIVLSLRDSGCTCKRIIAEVHDREVGR